MESLYLLIPISVALVLALIALFAWAMGSGQFEALEVEGERILDVPAAASTPPALPALAPALDVDQAAIAARPQE